MNRFFFSEKKQPRHANPVDFFMDLVTPEVSTAEVKFFVNHYGQDLGGWLIRQKTGSNFPRAEKA